MDNVNKDTSGVCFSTHDSGATVVGWKGPLPFLLFSAPKDAADYLRQAAVQLELNAMSKETRQ